MIDPAKIAAEVKEQMEAAAKDPLNAAPPPPLEPVAPVPVQVTPQETKPSATQLPIQPTEGEEQSIEDKELSELIDPSVTSDKKTSIQDSYKNLNTKFKETIKAYKAKETEAEEWKKKVEAYETGTAIPKVLQEKEDKLQKLEHFKNLVDFKASDEYQDKVAKPIEAAKTKLKVFSDSYNVPVDVILDAKKGRNEAQFNQFLSENFDPVGAIELKGLVENLSSLEAKASEAESSPQKALDALRAENQKVREVQEAERVQSIHGSSKRAWVDALNQIKQEGKFTALIYSDTNQDFNERTVKPLLTQAVTEYSKTVQLLADKGIKELPPVLAKVIALGHLYGTCSGVVMEAAMQAMEETETLRTNTQNMFKFNRPSVGGGGASGSSSPSQQPTPQTPKEAAEAITKQVLASRRR